MTKMRKSIQMRGMNLLHFMLITGIMLAAWFAWCAPLPEARNAQTVSLSVCACYMVFSIFLLRTYNAYKIGIFRAGEVFYAQTLANLFSNGITYVFACLIQLRLLPVWPVLVVFCGQTFVCVVWCLAANRLYFKLHPPMKTLIIYQSESDLEKLHEIVHFENRFDVQKKLKMPAMLYDILQAMNGYQAVIVSGVEATLRNGIVKECINKDINCYFIPPYRRRDHCGREAPAILQRTDYECKARYAAAGIRLCQACIGYTAGYDRLNPSQSVYADYSGCD